MTDSGKVSKYNHNRYFFDLQIIEELPKEDFDIPVDFIITEKKFIDPAKENSF